MIPFLSMFAVTFLFIWFLLRTVFQRRLLIAERVKSMTANELIGINVIEPDIPFRQKVSQLLWKSFSKLIHRLTPSDRKTGEQRRLSKAGILNRMTLQEWLAWRVISFSIGLLLAFFVFINFTGLKLLFIGMFVLFVGYYYPISFLKRKGEERQKEITKMLPDVLDLLTVSVEAGLGFDAGIAKVVEKTEGPLAEEFGKTLQEIRMGKGRREALKDLAKRAANPDLTGFITAIVQADQLGVSIGNVLRIQSEDIRRRRRARAEEQAMKAPIKILIPLILFIFPSIFIIILGPAGITIFRTLVK